MAFANINLDRQEAAKGEGKETNDQTAPEDPQQVEARATQKIIKGEQFSSADLKSLFDLLYRLKPGQPAKSAKRVTLTGTTPAGIEETLTLWESR